MASGKAIGVIFDGMHRYSEILVIAVKLPRLERATYRYASVSAALIKPLSAASRLTEITIEEPASELPDEAISALAELKSLKQLTLRGVKIGEDVEYSIHQRLPHVEVIVEPPTEQKQDTNGVVANSGAVKSIW